MALLMLPGSANGQLAKSGRQAGAIWLCLILFAVCAVPLGAGQREEYQVKAAYLYHFANFVEWPAEVASDPIVICILGPNPFGSALEETVNGKAIEGRPFAVRQLSDPQSLCQCRMLFVHRSQRKQFRSLWARLKGAGVLTVGEDDEFTADGGTIDFKLENGKVHLEINTAAAEYGNLRISSKMLSLARVVRKMP